MVDYERPTTQTRQSRTLFEPDFQPIQYGRTNNSSVYTQPEFEIEKPYSFTTEQIDEQLEAPSLTKSYGETEIVAHGDTDIIARADTEIVARHNAEIVAKSNSKIRLNARGKVAISVYSIIVAILMAFAIYSGVMIASYKSQIIAKSEIIASQEEVINSLSYTYNSLGESDSIYVSATDFEEISETNTTHIADFEMAERSRTEVSSNWFERFCESLRKLFS